MGHHDTDGCFFITDRKKDMLLVHGINVYPREIEEIFYQFSRMTRMKKGGWNSFSPSVPSV